MILNDNQMSISRNVGAISAYLNRTFTGEFYTRLREETSQLLTTIPQIGENVKRMAMRAEELAKGLILPGLLFEELGFRMSGPSMDIILNIIANLRQCPQTQGATPASCHY